MFCYYLTCLPGMSTWSRTGRRPPSRWAGGSRAFSRKIKQFKDANLHTFCATSPDDPEEHLDVFDELPVVLVGGVVHEVLLLLGAGAEPAAQGVLSGEKIVNMLSFPMK